MNKREIMMLTGLLVVVFFALSGCNNTTEPDGKKVAQPELFPPGRTYYSAQVVTITCATAGATIFYSLDGSVPSNLYTSPVAIYETSSLKARAVKNGYADSELVNYHYNIMRPSSTVAIPTINPPGGSYSTAQSVSLSCATSGAAIHYTTNGAEPTLSSPAYSSAINVFSTTTIKAKAFKDDWTYSTTASATYTISAPPPSQMIYVPGGTFTMGRATGSGESDELPTHTVTLNSYYIGQYEVTQAEYTAIMGSNPASGYGVGDNYPVYRVSWYSILKYCNMRSSAEGLTPVYSINGFTNTVWWGAVPTSNNATWNAVICNWNANGYRLPTEAEWEYAARSATNTPDYLYSGSDDINAVAWYNGNAGGSSHSVGTKAPNGIGAFDMSGNVYEWCWDWYSSSYYSSSPSNNPTGPTSGSWRVIRGGGWYNNATGCRVAVRLIGSPYNSNYNYGFRLCRGT